MHSMVEFEYTYCKLQDKAALLRRITFYLDLDKKDPCVTASYHTCDAYILKWTREYKSAHG